MQRTPSPLPGVVLSSFLFCLTLLAWPEFLESFLRGWQWGSRRPIAYGLQILACSLTLASLLAQRRINSLYAKMFPTWKQLIFAVIVVSFSSIISLIIAEIAFRLYDFPFKVIWTPHGNSLTQFDDELGWSYIPNQSIIQQFGSERREVIMHLDNIGSRVRMADNQHDPDAPTVLFVGCSFTMGHGLLYEETFVGQLESMPEFPLQLVNLGVQGYGTDQSLLLLKRHLKKLNTKVVVYTYIYDHVWRNANYDRRILVSAGRDVWTKPLFALHRNETLYLKKRPRRYENITSSHVWASLQQAWRLYGPVPTFDLTRALVQEMKEYTESNGAMFVLIHWRWGPKHEGFPFRGMDLNLIDIIGKTPPDFSDWAILGDGHPDMRAHLYIARLVAEEFKSLPKNVVVNRH
jgi:hypothetical protein